jgi:hypothetical protein
MARIWSVNGLRPSIKGSCTAAHLAPTGKNSIISVLFFQIFGAYADKSLARPTSRCILFDGNNISFDASLIYIYIYIYIYILGAWDSVVVKALRY